MWVIKINSIDSSCHTQECDALTQKSIFISSGVLEANIEIVEQNEFNPPQFSH
jgi:hypothetical protein